MTFDELQTNCPYITQFLENGKFFDWDMVEFDKDGFNLKTNKYKYSICCTSDYLGCIMGGKDGGSDLADGPNNNKTWLEIVSDILSCELK